ncbi:MAG: LapA family protein [Aquihabitans sp.]
MTLSRSDHRGADERPIQGTGVTRYIIAAVVLGALFVVLAAQNASDVTVELLPWSFDAPLYAVAIVSLLIGALVAESLAAVWRHRRHQRNRELQELIDLRDDRTGNLAYADDTEADEAQPIDR